MIILQFHLSRLYVIEHLANEMFSRAPQALEVNVAPEGSFQALSRCVIERKWNTACRHLSECLFTVGRKCKWLLFYMSSMADVRVDS